jgi:hypothetical protein
MIIGRNNILSPWESYEDSFGWKQPPLLKRIFGKANLIRATRKAFKRNLIKPIGLITPSYYYVCESREGWATGLANRFVKIYKNANDAMIATDEILIKEGFYLIDDWKRFEKLKVLI